jgi:hypothetical protein
MQMRRLTHFQNSDKPLASPAVVGSRNYRQVNDESLNKKQVTS